MTAIRRIKHYLGFAEADEFNLKKDGEVRRPVGGRQGPFIQYPESPNYFIGLGDRVRTRSCATLILAAASSRAGQVLRDRNQRLPRAYLVGPYRHQYVSHFGRLGSGMHPWNSGGYRYGVEQCRSRCVRPYHRALSPGSAAGLHSRLSLSGWASETREKSPCYSWPLFPFWLSMQEPG